MNRTIKIEFTNPFHNSDSFGMAKKSEHRKHAVLSARQINKITNQLCGIKDCACGNHIRAVVAPENEPYRQVYLSQNQDGSMDCNWR